ncbi:hypothetical protein AMTRI_Chr01g130540 [Amborella trichopoda]
MVPLFLLLFFLSSRELQQVRSLAESEDASALLAFRSSIRGVRYLPWNMTQSSPCSWLGVICDDKGRVVALKLPGKGLSGTIPSMTLGNLTHLTILSLRFNGFLGALPSDIVKCTNLRSLYLQSNHLSGNIPDFLFQLHNLVNLDLAMNQFSGGIPAQFNDLTRLVTLDIDDNRLEGPIPALKLRHLKKFNVSFNRLNGSVPSSLMSFGTESFLGNSLCGAPLAPCPGGRTSGLALGLIIAIASASLAVFILIHTAIFLFFCKKKSKRGGKFGETNRRTTVESSDSTSKEYSVTIIEPQKPKNRLVFLRDEKMCFGLEDLLRASAEVLGNGSTGTTYKAVFEMGKVVVVKRLRGVDVGEREFVNQMKIIGKMEHENVATPSAYYFSMDEKLLVYDYFPMGSLHGHLKGGKMQVEAATMYQIALGAAKGIGHIHSLWNNKLSHGNIKSSNIMITQDYRACISDYGLKSILTCVGSSTSQRDVTRAPEVTDKSKISQKADVYSFGIVLIVMLIGRQNEVHPTFEDINIELLKKQVAEEMVELLQIAVVCIDCNPEMRPTMNEVVQMIENISCKLDNDKGQFGDPNSNEQSPDSD